MRNNSEKSGKKHTENNNFICKICGKSFNSIKYLGAHLTKYHPEIEHKQYYDHFLRGPNENILCPVCGKERKFKNLTGYFDSCGNKDCISGVKKIHFKNKTGYEHQSQTKHFKDSYKRTCHLKYGTNWYVQTDEFKRKFRDASLERFGVDHPNKSDEQTKKRLHTVSLKTKEEKLLERKNYYNKTGHYYPFQVKSIRDKCKNTFSKTHKGLENPSQDPAIRVKQKQRYVFFGERFDSSWELAYYIYCKDHDIQIERNHKKYLTYHDGEKTHRYFPDFIVDGRYVEIKGSHLIDKCGNMLTIWESVEPKIRTSKTKCMQDNNVLVVTRPEIYKYLDYVKYTYGTDYLQKFRNKR